MTINIVFLTGAGISKESGINTFRDTNGLWSGYDINEFCTHSAWNKDPTKVQDFYNARRIEILNAEPNLAHHEISKFQKNHSDEFNISIVTQNIDDLSERAGSNNITHVHGEILKARSSNPKYDWMGLSDKHHINNPKLYDVGRKGLNIYRDVDPHGFPLRPHVVFFGETLINYNDAVDKIESADVLVIVGTSLNVYPVASFPQLTKRECKIYYIDPTDDGVDDMWCNDTVHVKEFATIGVPEVIDEILMDYL